MSANCDFCGSLLEAVYTVPESPKGAVVHACECGLLQSVYASNVVSDCSPRLSSGPDWGNIRHGKGVRLADNVAFIAKSLGSDFSPDRVLDIGSNRGRFCEYALTKWKPELILGIEPDKSIVRDYPSSPSLELRLDRFENCSVSEAFFDFVYCSHTLEHASSASEMLRSIFAALQPGGAAFIEVPSIKNLSSLDLVEEFFIDKHAFHFHPGVVGAFAQSVGFQLLAQQEPSERLHATFLLRRPEKPLLKAYPSPESSSIRSDVRTLLASYKTNLPRNRKLLGKARDKIDFLIERQRVAIWGAGRQLDAFIKYGPFDLSRVQAVVDEHLHGIVQHIHGFPISSASCLRVVSPQVLVVFANASFQEISDKARRYGIKNVIKFSDLILN
jgi:SAM-dependent methyltransferase